MKITNQNPLISNFQWEDIDRRIVRSVASVIVTIFWGVFGGKHWQPQVLAR